MSKRAITGGILTCLIIITGNAFWYLFVQSLEGSHILSSSAFIIIVSLLSPIFVLSVYLALLPFLSIFIQRKILLFFFIFLSMFDYSHLIEGGYLSMLGEIIISVSIYFFLVHFHQVHVIDKEKTSILGKLSIAFSNTSLIISLVVAFNFYNFYVHTLSSQNVFLTNKIVARALSPVVKVYLDDLHVTNLNENFLQYSKRRAIEIKKTEQEIKNQVKERLGVDIQNSDTMKDVIKRSLNKTIFKFVYSYREKIPILVSLGFGVITQTLISASTFISNIITIALLHLLLYVKLVRYEKKEATVDSIVPV